jgi:hypothetical protein
LGTVGDRNKAERWATAAQPARIEILAGHRADDPDGGHDHNSRAGGAVDRVNLRRRSNTRAIRAVVATFDP